MTDKILLALQFWNGDAKQAARLASFLAELQKGHSDEADFLFISRFDTPHNLRAIKEVSRKFNTFRHRCTRRGTGWPTGCNDLWMGTLEWVLRGIEKKRIPQYKAVFTFEADGVPLVSDWVSRLSSGWDSAAPASVWGAYLTNPGPHINGNCFFSCRGPFLDWLVRKADPVPAHAGWDCFLYESFKQWGAAPTNLIRSLWRTPTFSEERHRAELAAGTVWVHGVKDDSLLDLSRQHLI